MHAARVPEDEVAGIQAGLQPFATAVLKPLECLLRPIEEISFDPTTVRLLSCESLFRESNAGPPRLTA